MSNKEPPFKTLFKTARKARKLTQYEAGLMIGYCHRTVQHWEAGTRIPHPVTQKAVLRRIEENAIGEGPPRSGLNSPKDVIGGPSPPTC